MKYLKYILFFEICVLIGIIIDRVTLPKNYIQDSSIIKINRKVSEINHGGCGYFAMKLYERLDRENYSIIQIGDRWHIVLLEKPSGLYIDSNGYHTKFELLIRYGKGEKMQEISYDSLRKLVYTAVWNNKFNNKDTVEINNFIDSL